MFFFKGKILTNFLRAYSNYISKFHYFCDILVTLFVFTNNNDIYRFPIIYYFSFYSFIVICLRSLQKSLRDYSLRKIIFKISAVYLIISLFAFFINLIFISDFENNIFNYIFLSNYFFYLYLLFSHFLTRFLLKNYRKRGGNSRSLLIWGDYNNVQKIFDPIINDKWLGINLKAWFSPSYAKKHLNYPFYKGGFNEMRDWLKNNSVDRVIISSNTKDFNKVINFFGKTNLNVYYFPSWSDSAMKLSTSYIGSQKLLSIWESNDLPLEKLIKRIFDLTASVFLLLILFPFFLLIYILIKITTKDKCFYKQERSGYNYRTFYIYKFRTMKSEDSGINKDLKQVVKDDKRITPIGKYLRKYSIDELPQLLNVVSGEMSLVGPRPHAVAHNELYRNKINGYMQRHSIKPGMTGLAQVKGLRGETKNIRNMKDRFKADLEYIQSWSLYLDLKILFKTFFIIFNGVAF